jgi:hypothetical protein
MIENLLSGLFGALIVTVLSAFVQWRFILRTKREEVAVHIRKLRQKIELRDLNTNDVFDAFKEFRDRIEDGCHAYAVFTLRPSQIFRAIDSFVGYADSHPYKTVHKMPSDRQEFLDRIDALESALSIYDYANRMHRK